jgi:hypothetical protein
MYRQTSLFLFAQFLPTSRDDLVLERQHKAYVNIYVTLIDFSCLFDHYLCPT